MQKLKLGMWVVGDKLENFENCWLIQWLQYSRGEWDSNVQRTYGNWRSKLEITKSREAEKSKKNRERRINSKEEEAKAGGETAVDQMEVAGDMEVTGDVVVSGCDDKNWWFWLFFFFFLLGIGPV